jgi:acyl carrier protein
MVPAYFVQLAEFPRAAGGKINRGALPIPGKARPALAIPLVAPRNPTEARLAGLWTEALRLDAVGVHDSFLELGGNSLRAMQLVSAIVDAFQVKLSARALFDAPTIAGMADVIALQLRLPQDRRNDDSAAAAGRVQSCHGRSDNDSHGV